MIRLAISIVCGLIIFYGITRIGIHLEKKGFNNGKCICCGNKLRYFDTDSQGGRGYMCGNCLYTTWVSYPSVDKKFKEMSEQ